MTEMLNEAYVGVFTGENTDNIPVAWRPASRTSLTKSHVTTQKVKKKIK